MHLESRARSQPRRYQLDFNHKSPEHAWTDPGVTKPYLRVPSQRLLSHLEKATSAGGGSETLLGSRRRCGDRLPRSHYPASVTARPPRRRRRQQNTVQNRRPGLAQFEAIDDHGATRATRPRVLGTTGARAPLFLLARTSGSERTASVAERVGEKTKKNAYPWHRRTAAVLAPGNAPLPQWQTGEKKKRKHRQSKNGPHFAALHNDKIGLASSCSPSAGFCPIVYRIL